MAYRTYIPERMTRSVQLWNNSSLPFNMNIDDLLDDIFKIEN
ncbi:7157_t:CDS:1, partial [Paraglomus brasilianum]